MTVVFSLSSVILVWLINETTFIKQLFCKHENTTGWFTGMTHFICKKCDKRCKVK